MTKVTDLIDALKQRENLTSNYQVAKLTGIQENRVNDYANGKRTPDAYAATCLALALGLDPIEVIAEIEAETETNEKKREFWRNFLTRAACIGASTVALNFGLQRESEASSTSHVNKHATYSQIMRTVAFLLKLWKRLRARANPTPRKGAMLCLQG